MGVEALLLDFFGTLARVDDENAYLNDVAAGLSEALGVDRRTALEAFLKARRLADAIREASLVEVPVDGQAALINAVAGGEGDWREVRKALVEAMIKHLTPIEGALDFLRWASSRYKLAIVSNVTCKCYIEYVLNKNNIKINKLITSDIIRYRKPHRIIFKVALKQLGASPSRTVMIGDDDVDLGAKALGILTVIMGDKASGDINFKGFAELEDWLQRLETI